MTRQVLAKAAVSVSVSGGLSPASAAWLDEARNTVAGTLCYGGRHASTPAGDPTLITLVPVTNLVPIPRESRLGLYNLMDGTITPPSSS